MDITVDGLRIHYTDSGEGSPVLLLHGWGSSVDAWRGIIGQFSGSFRMVAVDFPGFGGSDLPPEPWDVERYVRFTLRFMEAVGLKDPILFGHSFGGRIILKMVGTGRANPPKIVLIDSAGVKPRKTVKHRIKLYSFKTVKFLLTLPFLRRHTAGLLASARGYFGSSDYNSTPEALRRTFVLVVNEDLIPYLPSISAPTLLVWGENDTMTPLSDAKKMERYIPDAGLCVIKGAGHFSFAERPYEVHRILQSFLNVR